MAAALQTAKKDLRRRMREALRQVPSESVVSQSRLAANQLFSLSEYQNARRISVYLSMPSGELSTSAIVHDALKSGKQVFIPYIHSVEQPAAPQKTSIMDMLALESVEEFESLERDKWGIPSLKPAHAASKPNCLGGQGVTPGADETTREHGLDLIVMPGMAFDQKFRRLGHGKGYYDHFLTRYSKDSDTATPKMPFLVALCLKEQMLPLVEDIPVSEHDWPIDAIITGDGQFLQR
ncbi:5-formyltetrahydrofolate cyclo-ligase [Aspergillus sp. HF37]|nr:5-formyltetrahydrofolate cyclo-ligase [Aspergillus sp. HF37]